MDKKEIKSLMVSRGYYEYSGKDNIGIFSFIKNVEGVLSFPSYKEKWNIMICCTINFYGEFSFSYTTKDGEHTLLSKQMDKINMENFRVVESNFLSSAIKLE